MIKRTLALAVVATVAAGAAYAQTGRDQIRIVGSSTVYPLSTPVAEAFGKAGKFKTPVIESTGTGGGFKLFCGGVGLEFPDISNASRRIEPSEVETCAKNGVGQVAEVKIGYDGITMVNSVKGPTFKLTLDQMYRAVAKQVPVDGKLVPNPYKTWNAVDKTLPAEPILVFGPGPNHGTRDAFAELVMDVGCAKYAEIKALDKGAKKAACQTVREDGAWVDVSEDYNVTMQKLLANPAAFGVITFSYLDQNHDRIKGATVNDVEPSFENIADGKYPVSRPLFFYVKKAHVGMIPGIKEYIAEFTSEKAWGPDGYLSAKGLIAMPDAERKAEAAKARELPDLKL